MNNLIKEALFLYDFKAPQLEFIRHNENITYKVVDKDKSYVLRVHKPIEGFSLGIFIVGDKSKYIKCEMDILNYLHINLNKLIQKPVKNINGDIVGILSDGSPVTVLQWIDGNDLSKTKINEDVAIKIGKLIAWLHQNSDSLIDHLKKNNANNKIDRYMYNQQLLKTVKEQIVIAADKKQISKEQKIIILESLKVIGKRMDELDDIPNMKGFIHADLSQSNLIMADNEIIPIDFSLSGYGYFYMDVGMILSSYKEKNIRKIIKKAYENSIGKEVPICYIDSFFALGVLLFIASQHDKSSNEDWFKGAMERWCNTIFIPLIRGI